MEKSFITNSKKETWELVPKILDCLGGRNVILLKGQLGSGKTTFSQGILNFLGARGPFTSPTFVIMKAYSVGKIQDTRYNNQTNPKLQIKNHKTHLSPPFAKGETESANKNSINYKPRTINCVYHLDCYRVGGRDVLELGWEEIVKDKSNLVLVEWPEKIESILPDKFLQMEFEVLGENKREVKLFKK